MRKPGIEPDVGMVPPLLINSNGSAPPLTSLYKEGIGELCSRKKTDWSQSGNINPPPGIPCRGVPAILQFITFPISATEAETASLHRET